MGGKVQSGNFAHDAACNLAEGVRQAAVAAAGSNQTAVNNAEITWARACLAMSGTATQSVNFSNIAATTGAVQIYGGKYGLTVSATFGGGNVQLQTLSLDGSTWINVEPRSRRTGNRCSICPLGNTG